MADARLPLRGCFCGFLADRQLKHRFGLKGRVNFVSSGTRAKSAGQRGISLVRCSPNQGFSARIRFVSQPNNRRIGILGGTFDPPHLGHLAAALAAQEQLALDQVLLVVANDPWQKTEAGQEVTAANHRLAMVEKAVADLNGISADPSEINRGGPTYTAATLTEMGNRFPEAELFLLIGGDVAPVLNTWVEAETVRQRATIVVMDRPGYHQAMPPEGWEFQRLVAVTPDIAGTEVRLRGQVGHDLTAMVPLAVADYIKKYGLYSGESCS